MFQAPRGTADILPQDQSHWHHVETTAKSLAQLYGYNQLVTPTFESTGLFARGVGEDTDIVDKEMYSFDDRGGNSLTLRPEGTAPICRSYLEHGMSNLPQPVRLYYFSPAFRYERPQAGRYREHHQFGIETIGDSDPSIDAEVIELAWALMNELGFSGTSLHINTIGDKECRPPYLHNLKTYYSNKTAHLCKDCTGRLDRNPLRLLDCKRDNCIAIADTAPKMIENLCEDCQSHWAQLLNYLDLLGISYVLNSRLVRGLDYYTRTVFEIKSNTGVAQDTLCGGGRYDGLIQELHGPPTPGIGFAAGMERIVMNLKDQKIEIPHNTVNSTLVAYLGKTAKEVSITLCSKLRSHRIIAIPAPSGRSLKSQLRYANALHMSYTLIIGDNEISNDSVTLKNMATGTQSEMSLANAINHLQGLAIN